jgi:hypothetical protein
VATKWSMQGTLLGACSCDWGCPCSFDAPPTQGFCDGGYLWHIEEGSFGGVSLAGLSWAWYGHSPAALHLGNVTWMIAVDEKATEEQREALEIIAAGKSGGPWTIFVAVGTRFLGPKYTKFDVTVDGLNSKAHAVGVMELELGPILNPVSGAPEEIYLDKPTGFTSKRLTLGASRKFRVTSDLDFDYSGKYAEFSKFSYEGEAPN